MSFFRQVVIITFNSILYWSSELVVTFKGLDRLLYNVSDERN